MPRQRYTEILLVALILVSAAFLARANYVPAHAERHVELAAETYDLDLGEPSQWFSAWSIGDGLAYAVIAADPSGSKLAVEVKEPAYRFSRAGYSWLAAAVTLGNDEWIPYGMAAVGLASLLGILILAVKMRERLGPWTWLLMLNPAIYLGFAGDTSEPLGVLILALAMASGSVWASVALGVTRPTYLLAMLARWRLILAGVTATVVLGLYSLWQFGGEDFIPDGGRIDLPLKAYFEHPSTSGWLLAGLAVATIAIGVWKRDWTWVVTGLFVLSFGPDVTRDPINSWRAAGLMPVLWAFRPGYEITGSSAATKSASSRVVA